MNKPVRILIVDDHEILRKGLSALFKSRKGYQVVAEAANGFEAVEQTALVLPDVILMDLIMPLKNGVEATKEIRLKFPSIAILALTSFDDDRNTLAAIRAGVNGYVLKTSSPDELLNAIQLVRQGGTYFPEKIFKQITRENDQNVQFELLTARELDVLRLLGKGYSNKEVATNLNLTLKTIEVHVSSILNKLNLENRTQAALFARDRGLE
jgi:DNA-binding NarL/FixJ family response regulator